MSFSQIPLRPCLAAASVLGFASPVVATPAPQARASLVALSGGHHDAGARLLPSRQSSSAAARRSPAPDPEGQVGAANAAARVQPDNAGFQNATQRYAYSEGALFQVYTKPGQVTDIALQEGETLVGPGPVAAGDTVRWMIGDTISGSGATARVHILV